MNEGLINLVDDDSSGDVQPAHEHPASEAEDRLATTRLDAHVPPPPPSRRVAPQAVVPPARQSYPTGVVGAPGSMLYPSEPPTALPRTSWWRSLIASTVAPASADDSFTEKRVGAACVGSALVFSLMALLVGLRGAPPEVAGGVAVAIVLSRGAQALGLLAFGFALLRMGERLLTSRPERKSGA